MDHSSTPLYPEQVGHISRMFCAVSESLQAEAMARRAAVVSCLATAGRPSEVAALEIKRLEYDPTLNCIFGENFQQKTSTFKPVMFVVGRQPERCWFLAIGDYLAVGPRSPVRNDDGTSHLLPFFQHTSSPGTVLQRYIKDLIHSTRWGEEWEKYTKANKATAAEGMLELAKTNSMRHGAIESMFNVMPLSHVAAISGHEIKESRASIYAGTPRYLMLAGAKVLAGWQLPDQYGTSGPAPIPPDLMSLVDDGQHSRESLDDFVNHLFRVDSASASQLQEGGKLRPMLRICCATMVMAYANRVEAKETSIVTNRMQRAWIDVYRNGKTTSMEEAAITLRRWSTRLQLQFEANNLHLTTVKSNGHNREVASAVQSLGKQLDVLSQGIFSTIASSQEKLDQHESVLQSISTRLTAMEQKLDILLKCPLQTHSDATRTDSTACKPPSTPSHTTVTEKVNPFTSIMEKKPKPVDYTLTGVSAGELLVNTYLEFNGSLPPIKSAGDRGRMRGCLDLLLKFAKADELDSLAKPVDPGAVRTLAGTLQQILAWMFFGGNKFAKVNFKEQGLWAAKLNVTSVQDRLQLLRNGLRAPSWLPDASFCKKFREKAEDQRRNKIIKTKMTDAGKQALEAAFDAAYNGEGIASFTSGDVEESATKRFKAEAAGDSTGFFGSLFK